MSAGSNNLARRRTSICVRLRPFVAGFLGALNWFGKAGVRPESTRISREAPAVSQCRQGSVESMLFLGNCVHVNVRLREGERAIAEVPRKENVFSEGESVWVHWQTCDEMRFE